jgi:hypothetical protein
MEREKDRDKIINLERKKKRKKERKKERTGEKNKK